MDQIVQHKSARETWGEKSLAYQMGNIGSEVSRSLKNREKPARFRGCFERALELFDFTIDSLQEKREFAKLREVCRAREEFCDFFNGNYYRTDPAKMQAYYDQFVSLI